MSLLSVNFDGLIGPTHNYSGLSFGNVASLSNAGDASHPRQAALQGLDKMRFVQGLGPRQGFLPPHLRPNLEALRALGFSGSPEQVCAAAWREDPALFANVASASAVWTANAATISPAPDTGDGRTHLSVANLSAMLHRSLEAQDTFRRLQEIFGDSGRFAVHSPLPARLGDEGAANHMRLSADKAGPGLEVFVYGLEGGRYPARQHLRASQALARRHGLDPDRAFFAAQSREAVDAGAFHNDVVAVAQGRVLLAHAQAFEQPAALYDWLHARLPQVQIVEAPAAEVSLEDAIRSYLFNSQLIETAEGAIVLIAPSECRETPSVRAWLERSVGPGRPIEAVHFVEVRESMRNGGGPACLRLHVALPEAHLDHIDTRYLLNDRRFELLRGLVETHWPERVTPGDLGDPDLWRAAWQASEALDALLGAPHWAD